MLNSEAASKAVVCVTLGDAAGIGPEIIMKALAHPTLAGLCHVIVVGDAKMLVKAEDIVGTGLKINRITSVAEARFTEGILNCLDLDLLPASIEFGQSSQATGRAAFAYIAKAVELAQTGEVDAICTAPLSKEALQKGGHPYPGHTEILAELTNTEHYAMLLVSQQLKVIHASTHQGLIEAICNLDKERVWQVIKLAHSALVSLGVDNPRIAVCGINPHAGEGGLFGFGEEEEKITPAIEKAEKSGFNVSGPWPADSVFYKAIKGEFDVVVAMYHDQGHIPVKVLGFEAGVNVTVGLPIIRTSVDHGTAFDIAGKGIASEKSLLEALRLAVDFAANTKLESGDKQ